MKRCRTRYYTDYTEDFEQTADQNHTLPDDYKWVRTDMISRFLSAIVYGAAVLFSWVYCKVFLRVKITGAKKLRNTEGGCFIYGNHTQPVGDVFIPALCAFPKRIYTVASTANYGIPVIGKILPFLGALPAVSSLSGIKKLKDAIEYRTENGNPVVIYPEAHVWEYYTDIRPFPDTSFKFPVLCGKPSFAMTVTYKKTKFRKRPKAEVFIDGPFFGDGKTAREKAVSLHQKIYGAMVRRSKNSDCRYIEYIKR